MEFLNFKITKSSLFVSFCCILAILATIVIVSGCSTVPKDPNLMQVTFSRSQSRLDEVEMRRGCMRKMEIEAQVRHLRFNPLEVKMSFEHSFVWTDSTCFASVVGF